MELKTDSDQSAVMGAEMNKVAQRYLSAMALVFTTFYVVRGVSYLLTYDEAAAGILGWPALATAALGGVLIYLTKKIVWHRIWIEVAFFGIGLFLIFNLFLNYFIAGNPILLTNIAFVLIAVGLGTTIIWNWLLQVVMTIALYGYVTDFFTQIEGPFFGIILVSGTLLSFLGFLARAPIMRERVQLEVKLMEKAEKLHLANEAKDRFVANMTHELRTPLTGVMGMMELMQDTKLDDEQQFMLTNAQKSAQYLLNVVNDILDFSKLEAGKLKLKPASVDLLSVCRDAAAVFEAQAKDKGLRLTLELPEFEKLIVTTDGLRIGQILMNFVGNAVKFTLRGEIKVALEWVPLGSGGYAKFSVTDTGIGIAAEEAAKLFHRFEQADSSATRTTTGTGLGLAICQELVTLMDGSIGVDSDVGEGSCFSFQIQVELAENVKYERAAKPEPQRTYSADEGRLEADAAIAENNAPRRRALLAEDNAINQTLILRMLELEGLDVTVVENGQQVVEVVDKAQKPFDIVFLDVQMPVMDGISATRIIRLRMKNPPPIVALTANTLEQDVLEYKKAGMAAVLGKPLNRKELRRVLREFFGGGL